MQHIQQTTIASASSAAAGAAQAATAANVRILSEDKFDTGKKPTMYVDAFLSMGFPALKDGPATTYPKIENGRMLPDSVHAAIDTVTTKLSDSAEYVVGGVLRVIDRGVDFAYDRTLGIPEVKLVKEGDSGKSFFTRIKESVTGLFTSDKKEEGPKTPTLTVVKSDKPADAAPVAEAITEQPVITHMVAPETVDAALKLMGDFASRVHALGEEGVKKFSDATDSILANHGDDEEKAKPELHVFLREFMKTELKMEAADIEAFIAESERVSALVKAAPEVALEGTVVETITTTDGMTIAVIDTGLMAAASQVAESQATADSTTQAVHEMMVAGADRPAISLTTKVADDVQTPAAANVASEVGVVVVDGADVVVMVEVQREAAPADGGGFAGNVEASMTDTLNEQYTVLFLDRFDAIRQSHSFNPDWLGDDGGLDGMYNSEELRSVLSAGFQMKMVDGRGRKIIATGTALGPVIVYEAVAGGHQLCFIAPPAVKRSGLLRSTGQYLNGDEVEVAVGSVDGKKTVNIGKSLGMLLANVHKS